MYVWLQQTLKSKDTTSFAEINVDVLWDTDGYQDIWAEQDVEPGPRLGHIVHIV